MIISQNTDSMAYAENQFYKAYNKFNSNDRKAYCRDYLSGIKDIYYEFCSSISGTAIINNEDKRHYFLNSFYRVFDLLYSNYSLDYISNGFVESVKPNIQKLIDSIAEFHFPFGTVELDYIGKNTFNLIDRQDVEDNEPHGYPKMLIDFTDEEGNFNAEAFYTEIIRELGYIYSTHKEVEGYE